MGRTSSGQVGVRKPLGGGRVSWSRMRLGWGWWWLVILEKVEQLRLSVPYFMQLLLVSRLLVGSSGIKLD